MNSNLLAIKNWYKPGTVSPNVAIYNADVVNSILNKSKEVSRDFKDFLPNLLDNGKMSTELYSYFAEDDEFNYDFKKDVAHQVNPFEYYKVIEIVEFWGANNVLYDVLPKNEQKDILDKYESYKTLVKKLNANETKFLNDGLKLVAGVASAYIPENDTAQHYNELTNTIRKEQPILPTINN